MRLASFTGRFARGVGEGSRGEAPTVVARTLEIVSEQRRLASQRYNPAAQEPFRTRHRQVLVGVPYPSPPIITGSTTSINFVRNRPVVPSAAVVSLSGQKRWPSLTCNTTQHFIPRVRLRSHYKKNPRGMNHKLFYLGNLRTSTPEMG